MQNRSQENYISAGVHGGRHPPALQEHKRDKSGTSGRTTGKETETKTFKITLIWKKKKNVPSKLFGFTSCLKSETTSLVPYQRYIEPLHQGK